MGPDSLSRTTPVWSVGSRKMSTLSEISCCSDASVHQPIYCTCIFTPQVYFSFRQQQLLLRIFKEYIYTFGTYVFVFCVTAMAGSRMRWDHFRTKTHTQFDVFFCVLYSQNQNIFLYFSAQTQIYVLPVWASNRHNKSTSVEWFQTCDPVDACR